MSSNSPAVRRESADVVILGAGPAGLVLGNILRRSGVDCVIVERGTRIGVQTRARAGFLAANTVRILDRHGLAGGLRSRGREHGTCEFRTEDGRFTLDYARLGLGERHTVYPQQELVTDLLASYVDAGGRVHFSTEALGVSGTDTGRPRVSVREPDGRISEWQARYVAGCDGRHGAARRSLPADAVRHYRRDHGVSWLALLVQAPPSLDAVGYAVHDRGFAGHMARSAEVTRYYLQCPRGTSADAWSEDEIWAELAVRMRAERYGPLLRGPVVERGVVDFESDVIEPLRYGSLFLAGDAASLISPCAAKGANLAVQAAEMLANAFVADLVRGDSGPLASYSAQCLAYIWRAQEFSHWMIQLLHGAPASADVPGESLFHGGLQRSRLESLRTSRGSQDWFAENYVGV